MKSTQAAATQAATGLERYGLTRPGKVHWNPPVPALFELALQRNEARLTATGALVAMTAPRTGRSPRDKFIVKEPATADSVAWGPVNQPMTPEGFERLLARVTAYLQERDLFICDAWAGADPDYRMPIRVVSEFAWHSLFARQLFRRPTQNELGAMTPQFLVVSVPDFLADPASDKTNSEAVVAVSFERRIVLIGGTHYAGEIKKSIFTVLNHLLPDRNVFPMHCSANVGPEGDVALFFGLSGTGKTTLSADPTRRLIGDDEHGWSGRGVFNFEGGCYAKCIRLSPEKEPQIYHALRFGAVLENVVIAEESRVPLFDDASVTENTRAAYPVEFISNSVPEGYVWAHPRAVIFLTCDAFGVLPPVARLTTEQAMYHFLSGYTAKLAGTETGMGSEPEAAFSTCFGAPFLPRAPKVYAEMLADKVKKHDARCYLINTGWSGGPFGVGERIRLSVTRAIVDAAVNDRIDDKNCRVDPVFGLNVPRHLAGVPDEVLDPKSTWNSPDEYMSKARALAGRFVENFKRFSGVSKEVAEAGPRIG